MVKSNVEMKTFFTFSSPFLWNSLTSSLHADLLCLAPSIERRENDYFFEGGVI